MPQKNYNRISSVLSRYLKVVMVILVLLLLRSAMAQNQTQIDSLKKVLSITNADKEKILVLNKLSKVLMDVDHQQSLRYWTDALLLAQKMNDSVNIIEAHFNIGQINVNYSLNYKNGLEHLITALKLVRKTDRRKTEMSILGLIGFVHNRQGDFNKAIEYYKKAIGIAEKYNYQSDYVNYSSYIADLFEINGMIDSAIVYYGKIYEIEEEQHFMHTRPTSFIAIGKYFELKNEYQQTIRYYAAALKAFENEGNRRWESYTYHLLAEIEVKKKNYKTALEYANKGLAIAEEFKLAKEIVDNHYTLAHVFDSIGNYEMAYKHYKTMDALGDSIFSVDRSREISNVQRSYELAMRENELEQLKKETERNKWMLEKRRIIFYLMSFIALFLVLLVFILWRGYRQKQKVNRVLINRDEFRNLKMEEIVAQLNSEVDHHKQTQIQLEASNEELNNFMYRSSHDIKSPLVSIIGLTNLTLTNISEKERLEALEMIKHCTEKLRKLLDELVEAAIVANGRIKITQVVFIEFIRDIVKELKNSEYFTNVKIEIIADEQLKIDTDENLLHAVLQNLIDNGIKYRNPSLTDSFLRIKAEQDGNKIKISISDNGQGIEEEQQKKVFDMFVRANLESQGSGLGLYIVKKSVNRLGGTIILKSEKDIGSTFIIELPVLLMREK